MKRSLVVDDKEENLYYLQALLRGHGYDVETARHGAEALVKARQRPPDLVVSDLLMPVMDGYTLLRHWRADPRLRKIPFVVYTATYTEAEDERLALSLGANAFILKPAEPEDFLSRLCALEAPASPPEPMPPPPGAESELLKVYSETLIRKLEEKTLQLEEANRVLQRDIAERARFEETLRESEERFRATFEQAAVGIAHVDARGRFLRVNDKLCEMCGRPREALLQGEFTHLLAPEESADHARVLRTLLEGGESAHTSERRCRRENGEPFWASLVTKLLRDERGAPKYFIAVIVDITERKTLEEQVFRTQRMESIGTLAGGIAHDLNNILAPILIGVELLAPTTADPELKRVVDTIARSATRGRDLVKQVLSFARGVEGARVAVHLHHIVREVESIAATTFPKNIVLTTSMPRDLWLVSGDPTQLTQIVLNLCVNARDAMPDGGRIGVVGRNLEIDAAFATMHRAARSGRYVSLEITDSGCGIPADILDRIFEPFFTTKDVGKGTGLGLSTVLGITRGHGGFVDVRSEPGQGSTFTVYLPVPPELEPPPAARPGTRELPRGNGELVLVVDDDTPTREILVQTLKSLGYGALPAEDGSHAIGLFALNREQVRVVITDMMMPVMDGPALVAALWRIDATLPIIASSGLHGDGDAARAAGCGIRHLLPKPYSADMLASLLRHVLHSDGATVR
ncbi:MAG TPA: response regulator [Opitutus sp.]|nr:response regulator [Opitutus sp.]